MRLVRAVPAVAQQDCLGFAPKDNRRSLAAPPENFEPLNAPPLFLIILLICVRLSLLDCRDDVRFPELGVGALESSAPASTARRQRRCCGVARRRRPLAFDRRRGPRLVLAGTMRHPSGALSGVLSLAVVEDHVVARLFTTVLRHRRTSSRDSSSHFQSSSSSIVGLLSGRGRTSRHKV